MPKRKISSVSGEKSRQRSNDRVRRYRSNSANRSLEQQRNTEAHRVRRSDSDLGQDEQQVNTQRRRARRADSLVRQRDRETNRISMSNNLVPWSKAVETYESNIKDGPYHICYSCDRMFFKTSMSYITRNAMIEQNCSEIFINQVVLDNMLSKETYQFCSTCYQDICKKKKFPKFNIKTSNLAFPEVPEEIKKLTKLEAILVSLRIPFMKIFALGCDRQWGIKGGVVNVPVEVPKMFKSIPILPEQTGVIHLKLKRMMSLVNHYIYERIRPAVVYAAAKLLMKTPLYIKEGVTLDENWEANNITIFNSDPDEDISEERPHENENGNAPVEEMEPENESDEQIHLQEETLYDSADLVEFAPGEGQKPIPLLHDKYCEELAFCQVWYGHARTCAENVNMSFEDHVNSEIRRSDRRAVDPDHLLFVNKKSQLKQLLSGINIAMKKAAQATGITASQALDSSHINDIMAQDNAYKFTAKITGSPAYWELQKKNVLAMVRQFGVFTMFITLSAAEAHWPELLKILKRTVDQEEDADVSELSAQEKSRLIRSDPVTCALYFNHRFKEIRKAWTDSFDGPFGEYKVENYFYRIEFQHRGSPHVHMILWLKDAPKFDPENVESFQSVTDFIDFMVTTTTDDPEVQEFVKYQKHKCTHTCRKTSKGKTSCRFGAPFPPLDKTMILQPLPEDYQMTQEEGKSIREKIKKINSVLDEELESISSFAEFLERIECTYDDYIYILRSQLKANKVILQRLPKNCRINGYNKKILSLMRSNIDVQYVLDPYACTQYVVDYIYKPQRGLSKLMRECIADFRRGNYSLSQKLRAVSNTLYNGSEISAQEAAWCRLRLPMSCSSVVVEFINTGSSNTRHRMVKSRKQLETLKNVDPESTDIYVKGPVERYAERPKELEELCFADFMALFSFAGKKSNTEDGDHQIEEREENHSSRREQEKYILSDGTLTRRRSPKVIRYCRFNVHKDPKLFFRELVMLFKPWRNEEAELDQPDCERIFWDNKDLIEANSKKYIALDLDFDAIYREIEEQRNANENEIVLEEDEIVNIFDYDDNVYRPDVFTEIGQSSAGISEVKKLTVPDQLRDNEFYALCDTLNVKQRDYLMHILSLAWEKDKNHKFKDLNVYHFISGGAGTGKSRLIKAIYQALLRVYRSEPGPVDHPEILIVSFTGKAAHNVGGMTAHSAFSLTIAQSESEMKDLSSETAQTIRVKLKKLKLIIIDEISMMGNRTFSQINRRLMQIFNSKKPFGGCSVIAVGDFQQLRPVHEGYVFSSERKGMQEVVGNPLWQNFKLFELNEIMRQKDDLTFAEALGRLAKGELTECDKNMFASRCFVDPGVQNNLVPGEKFLPVEGIKATRLIWQNDAVERYNQRRMQQLEAENSLSINFRAIDKVTGANNKTEEVQALHNLKDLPARKTHGLEEVLKLQIGVRYMVTSNIDVEDGLFNGATGILRFMEIAGNKVYAIYLEFDDIDVGKKARSQRQNIIALNPNIKSNWTPIQRVTGRFQTTRKRNVQIIREQYPVVVAEAITIHKSQGMSMDFATINLDPGMTRSLLYVSCSRVTSLNGLHLVGEFKAPAAPEANYLPLVEMRRLRANPLIPMFTNLRSVPEDTLQIVSYNVQSLRKHINSVNGDAVFDSSQIIGLQETWILADENIELKGKYEVMRNKFYDRPKARGTILFSEQNLCVPYKSFEFEKDEQHIEITSCKVEDLFLLNIYVNPKTTQNFFKCSMDSIRNILTMDEMLIFGDYNQNFFEKNYIEDYLKQHNFKFLSPRKITTHGDSCIDAVFGKLSRYQVEIAIYESYSSFHKPLVIRVKNEGIQQSVSTLLSKNMDEIHF